MAGNRAKRQSVEGMRKVSEERKADAFLGALVVILLLSARWEDNLAGKSLSLAVALIGCIGVLWQRRHLARPWLEIYSVTFLAIAIIMIVSLLFRT